jgi:hypothetical protein
MAGQSATIKLDTLDSSLDGSVSTVQDGTSTRSGRTARLKVDWLAEVPPYGSFAQVQLQVNHKDGVIVVPKKAVHTAGARRYVQVQTGTTRKIVNVEVGIVSADTAEITSGLTEGQIVYVGS